MSWAFAHTRLAINDLSPAGDQPMSTDDGSLVMVFNGEIYNAPQLRTHCERRGRQFRSSMDGEVILHLWALDGPACLNRLNGIFAVALADTRAGDLVLIRDPLGVKPLFYSIGRDGAMHFASELRALLAAGAALGDFDVAALAQFLTFLWIPDPRTPYSGARSVEPGTFLRWSGGHVEQRRYSSLLHADVPAERTDVAEAAEEGSELLQAAVRRQLLSDVPVGLMASGGIDSGLLWWGASGSLERAYTITWESPSSEGLDEDAEAVRRSQAELGTPVVYLPGQGWEQDRLPQGGDLLADPAYELTRSIASAARDDGVKVLLSGQGGDEVFGGYRRHQMASVMDRIPLHGGAARAAQAMARLAKRSLYAEYLFRLSSALRQRDPFLRYMELCVYSSAADRARVLGCTEAEVSDEVVYRRHAEVFDELPNGISYLRKAMALDLNVYLPGLGLAYADRGGMEEGIEVRVPLLDLDFVRWSLRLPDDLLVHRGRSKRLSKEIAARHLPRSVVYRPKRGFGAPASEIETVSTAGSRGFRQAGYFNRAVQMLQHFMDAAPFVRPAG
jgi:asparagine synthase (glutamine-hydrolysing)